jgi:quercetin dioxygenase-like cupin family protein
MKKRVFENSIIKDRVMLVESSNETGGAYTLLEVELQAGSGNQFHYHASVGKRFTVIQGELGITVGRHRLRCRRGSR